METPSKPGGSSCERRIPSGSDTKDFAEHLRAIHFALAAVCLGLLVIVSQPPRSELTRAYDQARDIAGLNWETDSLSNLLEADAAAAVDVFKKTSSPASGELDAVAGPPQALEIAGKRYNVTFTGRNWGFLQPSPPNPMLEVGEFDGAQIQLGHPKNLADFRALWDGIESLTAWGGEDLVHYGCIRNGSTYGGTNEAWYAWKPIAPSPGYEKLSFSLGSFQFDDATAVPTALRGHFRHVFASQDEGPQIFIPTVDEIPVAIIDGQQDLIRTVSGRWKGGAYAYAFEELHSVTSNYEDVDLKAIVRIVGSERDRSKDVFQAFGITFPVDTTAQWGILIVIAVQIHFLFHLREFRTRRMQNVSVAWIGLYSAWPPRFLFLTTACAFPVIVVSYSLSRGLAQWSNWLEAWVLSGLAIVVSLALAALSAREGWLLREQGCQAEL